MVHNNYAIWLCTPKITQARDDAGLKMVFDDADMLGSLLETGFRIPLHNIGIKDKNSIVNSLKDYHCIIKVSKSDCVLYNRPRPNCRSWLFSQGYTFIDAISTVLQ